MGYLLHPVIPTAHPNLKIVDIGTGTATWLLDLAKYLPPSAQLDGFDITDLHYPHKGFLFENISLGIMNVMNGPLPHLWEKYDIVHIRFFTSKDHGTKPAGVLKNCLKLLKPGGYMQWDEFDAKGSKILVAKDAIHTSHVNTLAQQIGNYDQLSWVEGLGQTFKDCGLEQVNIDVRQEPYQITKMSSEMLCMDCEDCSWATDDLRHGDKLRDISRNAHIEMRQGITISKTLQVVVGRKPQRQQGLSAGKRLVPHPIQPKGLHPSRQTQWSEEQYRPTSTH